MKKDALAQFTQGALLDPLFEQGDVQYKKMFGGLAVYFNGRMVLCFMEDPETRTYKEKTAPYPIWDGILVPTDRAHHASLLGEFPGLIPHPVLGKWLYLPRTSNEYETDALKIIEQIGSEDLRIGIESAFSERKRKAQSKRAKTSKKKKRRRT